MRLLRLLSPIALALAVSGCVETAPTPYEVEDARLHDVGMKAEIDAMKGVDTSQINAME